MKIKQKHKSANYFGVKLFGIPRWADKIAMDGDGSLNAYSRSCRLNYDKDSAKWIILEIHPENRCKKIGKVSDTGGVAADESLKLLDD